MAMSRYLFVVPPLAGHVNPAVGVAAALVERGHEVAWVAHSSIVGHLLAADAVVYPAGDRFLRRAAAVLTERDRLRGVAALRFLWQRFLVPLAYDMVPRVQAAVGDYGPDVIVADQQALAGGLVADQRGIRWATSATTSAELMDPFALVPTIARWIDETLAELRSSTIGARRESAADPRFSPYLVLVYSTEALTGPISRPGNFALVGPVLSGRPGQDWFPWAWLDDRPVNVLVSLGTVNQEIGQRFVRTVIEAAEGRAEGFVVAAAPESFPVVPDNVLVRRPVPLIDLLGRVRAVVTHGGHNTVCESLAHGQPLIVAPIRDDQPVIAAQVVRSGAGLRVSFPRVNATQVQAALDTVLTQPEYRSAAGRVAESFAAAGGAARAADLLEDLAWAGTIPARPAPVVTRPFGGAVPLATRGPMNGV
jgi:MGT family glycosyltransferase